MINKKRLDIANQILDILYPTANFTINEQNRLYLNWQDYRGNPYSRPWATEKGSCYPSWYRKLAIGGTHITAIAQLALWVRELPCYPIQTWKYWCGDSVGMRGGDIILPLLRDSNCYPDGLSCAFCGFDTLSAEATEIPDSAR